MEEAARNGTREEAEAMLDEMQEMFENMRSAGEDEESPAERAMRKEMDELGKLLRDQQALRDDTFRSDQRDRERRRAQRRASPPGQDEQAQPDDNGQDLDQGESDAKPGEGEANPDGQQLEQRQRALRDRLAELQRMLKGLGMKGEKGFDDAQKDMKEAEGDLKGEQGQGGEQGRLSGKGKRQGRGGGRARARARGAARGRAGHAEADERGPGPGSERQGRI